MIEVKLLGLHVTKLYGNYNYDVKFNSDVTFIFGVNGCGKTTILNITEAIITGCLYKLFDYDFDKIILEYTNQNEEYSIQIDYKNNDIINISFKSKEKQIKKLDVDSVNHHYIEELDTRMRNMYFDQFSILREIHETFNYVYLPLNRSLTYEYIEDDYRFARRYTTQYGRAIKMRPNSRDKALRQVEMLVYEKVNKINNQISKINDEFRNEILKSSLDIDSSFKFADLYQEITAYSKNKIKNIEKSYISILTELDIISDDERNRYIEFFSSIVSEMESKSEDDNSLQVSLVLKYKDILRIKKLSSIAEKMEKNKANARKDIELFLTTINKFIMDDEEGKEIVIEDGGKIGFITRYRKNIMSVNFLSSGEKQLLIFFANLIFNVGNKKNGIFVVDEPELSLHLSWQKIFVERTMNINPNIQLIFATHSPEFVGKYRDKMFRLEKHTSE